MWPQPSRAGGAGDQRVRVIRSIALVTRVGLLVVPIAGMLVILPAGVLSSRRSSTS
ncbi:hypothetical protein Acsp02_58780 [Actinoplanes sp. NBRC 103695]|nr:hypothetical protein Acsp02_58780 [Actinoplanes sp. NBRC 103695]